MAILESLGVRAGWEIGRQVIRSVPRALRRRRFARFFGDSTAGWERTTAVLDPYEHLSPRSAPRYVKRSHGCGEDLLIYGADQVIGLSRSRFVSYATAAFAGIASLSKPLRIVADHDALALWDGTFICFGSPDTNLKNRAIERLEGQSLFHLAWGVSGEREWRIQDRRYGAEDSADHGIIVRFRNPYFNKHWLFVCAGLSEWGSTGAAYLLFTQWERLHREYKTANFCAVVRVELGSDQSAHIVHVAT
jgi:hypothetical protein